MIVQSYEEFLEDRGEDLSHRVVVTCYSGNCGYTYSLREGDFIIQDGNIIPVSDRFKNRIKPKQ